MLLLIIFGGLVNWSAFYIVPPLIVHAFFYGNRKVKLTISILFWLCVAIFGLHLLHLKLLTGSFLPQEYVEQFFVRIDPSLSQMTEKVSLKKYVLQEIRYLRIYYGNIVFGLSILGTAWIGFKIFKLRLNVEIGLLAVLAVAGSIQIVLFRQLSFIHDYMIFYATAFICLSAALVLVNISKKILGLSGRMLLLAGVLTLNIFQTKAFTKALFETQTNARGRNVGLLINQLTQSGEKTLVTSNSYKEFQEVFIAYYADRNVGYAEKLPENLAETFNLVVIPKDHAALPEADKKYLNTHFQQTENADFVWYRVK